MPLAVWRKSAIENVVDSGEGDDRVVACRVRGRGKVVGWRRGGAELEHSVTRRDLL